MLWHIYGWEDQCCCRSKRPDEYCGDNCCGLSCWNTPRQQRHLDAEVLKDGSGASAGAVAAAKGRQEVEEASEKAREEGIDVWAPDELKSQASKKLPPAATASGAVVPQAEEEDAMAASEHRAVDISAFRGVEQFFYKYWVPFVHWARFPLLALFGLLVVLSAVGASFLEGPD